MLLAIVLIGFIAAPLVPWFLRTRGGELFFVLLPASIFATLVAQSRFSFPISERTQWGTRAGVDLLLHLDLLSFVFALIVSGMGFLIFLYANRYFSQTRDKERFFSAALPFMGAMLGTVLSENLLLLFVFWELTGFASYFLIAFNREDSNARSAALNALLITGMGGLLMLAGFLIIGQATGSFELAEIQANLHYLHESPDYRLAFFLILIGAMTKSAQFPFHFWLPGAMVAPTPVSAYLHSATMVKLGIFLLLRLSPFFHSLSDWSPTLANVGWVTFAFGGLVSSGQSDLKRLLAYSTVSFLGLAIAAIGVLPATEPGTVPTILALTLAHALYKGALFLGNGNWDHLLKTRDLTRVKSLRSRLPKTAFTMAIALLGYLALPPSFAFAPKEALLTTLWQQSGPTAVGWVSLFLLGNTGLAAAAFRIITCFAGPKEKPTAEKFSLIFPGMITGFLLILGVFFAGNFGLPPFALHFDMALTLTLITIAAGWVWARKSSLRLNTKAINGSEIFLRLWRKVLDFGDLQHRIIQTGRLTDDLGLAVIFLSFLLAIGWVHVTGSRFLAFEMGSVEIYELALALLLLVATLLLARTRSRLLGVAYLGVVGTSLAGIFAIYGLPDLAITQFAAESLSVFLFILAIRRLPPIKAHLRAPSRWFAVTVSLALGIFVFLISAAAMSHRAPSRLTPFFLENTQTLAHGRNIVNVILVDFRGFDTLGEISVLAIATVGIAALLGKRTSGGKA